MKKTKLIILAISLCLLSGSAARIQAADQSGKSVANSVNQQRKEYQKQVQAQLKELDRQISKLKKQAARKGNQTQVKVNREIRTLDEKSEIARAKLKQLEGSSQGAWENMKTGMDSAMKDLDASYQRAAADFK